jgi:hypothetical protein
MITPASIIDYLSCTLRSFELSHIIDPKVARIDRLSELFVSFINVSESKP